MKEVILIMGISGSGKSTVGIALSKRLGIPFIDADDFHPKENIMKMSRGLPLTDEDRWPWLASIAEHILNSHRDTFILACSALKQTYRDYLGQRLQLRLVVLQISEKDALERLNQGRRHGHCLEARQVGKVVEGTGQFGRDTSGKKSKFRFYQRCNRHFDRPRAIVPQYFRVVGRIRAGHHSGAYQSGACRCTGTGKVGRQKERNKP
jgi:gluconokinase